MSDVTRTILDPCSGSRMMWFARENDDVIFGDHRREVATLCDGRVLRVEPDVILDACNLPYQDGQFRLVVLDPPHLTRAGEKSWLRLKYGRLPADWHGFLTAAFAECFRVLNDDGFLVFKWNETQVRVSEVLKLTPHTPLFGHPTALNGKTHWIIFAKKVGVA